VKKSTPPKKRTPTRKAAPRPSGDAESTVAQLEDLITQACATTAPAALKDLHRQLSALDLLEASDAPGMLKRIKAVFDRVNERLDELDPASEASFELQCIRDTITSS
jgi:hypothetical protein